MCTLMIRVVKIGNLLRKLQINQKSGIDHIQNQTYFDIKILCDRL